MLLIHWLDWVRWGGVCVGERVISRTRNSCEAVSGKSLVRTGPCRTSPPNVVFLSLVPTLKELLNLTKLERGTAVKSRTSVWARRGHTGGDNRGRGDGRPADLCYPGKPTHLHPSSVQPAPTHAHTQSPPLAPGKGGFVTLFINDISKTGLIPQTKFNLHSVFYK